MSKGTRLTYVDKRSMAMYATRGSCSRCCHCLACMPSCVVRSAHSGVAPLWSAPAYFALRSLASNHSRCFASPNATRRFSLTLLQSMQFA